MGNKLLEIQNILLSSGYCMSCLCGKTTNPRNKLDIDDPKFLPSIHNDMGVEGSEENIMMKKVIDNIMCPKKCECVCHD